jgi:N-acetylglutamate synthase/N-acetylornithine aminotransferase
MTLIKDAPFQPQRTEEEREEEGSEIIKVRLNVIERSTLEQFKQSINQAKDGTALKQALDIANAIVATDGLTKTVLRVVLGNRKRAQRIGIPLNGDEF